MSEHVGKRSLTEALAPVPAPTAPAAPEPGGRTLVQQLESSGGVSQGAVHAAAERGIQSSATALPFADTLQRAFGHHDISGVQAHQGPEASASARAMGATAYATGNHVVLGASPDLFTVAHETAHVVQQRGGVQLKGGVGEAGDPYEQHANEVAALVVQGKSAQPLLDQHTGGQPTTATASVQRSVQLLNDDEGRQLRLHIIRTLEEFGLTPTPTLVDQVMNVANPQPGLAGPIGGTALIMEPDARSLEQARNAATMAIIRYAMINMPNRETVTEHNERMGVTDMDIDPPSAPQGQASQPQPQASTSQPQPQASTSLPEPQASTSQPQPQASTSPLERRPARNRLFAGLNVRSQAETEQARTQRENAQRVESEQERWARERREGGAAIAPRLATANIRLHGGRARAHTTDGGGDRQAGISSQQAIQLVAQAQASDVEANRDGGTDAPTYTIPIPANSMLGIPAGGTIVFSSPDGGVTVNIFHIGPGARH